MTTTNGTWDDDGAGGGDLSAAVLMFNWVEYCVFGSMLFFSLLIGVYYGWFKKQDTVAEYMLGGKKMGVFPITMSMVASHVSGVTLLGVPAEIYTYGTQFCSLIFCNIIIYFLVVKCFLPVFYHLQMNSVYEYLELRFSKNTRTLASLIFAVSLIVFIPVVVYVPALAFNQVTGVSVHVITPIISLICIFYTSFGGLKAVVWTDALQGVFTTASVVFIVILGFNKVGSVSQVFTINDEGARLEFWNMNPGVFERTTFWTMAVGCIFTWIPSMAIHPGAAQRFIAVPTFADSKAVMFWSSVGFFVINGLVVLIGLLMYATYYDCDPIATRVVQKAGQILPIYVMSVAQKFPGLTGLFISGVVSAALSTMSAGLNTVAGTLYEDFVLLALHGHRQSEATQNYVTKVIVLVLGAICTALVVVVERLGGIFQMYMSLVGVTNGALGGSFILGLFFPRANSKGVVCGMLVSMSVMSVIVFGAQYYVASGLIRFPGKVTSVDGCPLNFTASLGFNATSAVETWRGRGSPVDADDSVPLIFRMAFIYYSLLGTALTIAVGLTVSSLSERVPPESLDPRLFAPIVRRFLPQKQRSSPNTAPAEQYKLVPTDQPNVNSCVKDLSLKA